MLVIYCRKCKKCPFYYVKSLQKVNKKGDLMLTMLILILDIQAISQNTCLEIKYSVLLIHTNTAEKEFLKSTDDFYRAELT